MKIAVLADFPPHRIDGFPGVSAPRGHFATWLPQIAESFAGQSDFELHWVMVSPLVGERLELESMGQRFHVLPTRPGGRAMSLFREDRRRINDVLAAVKPDLVHGWGSEDVYGYAAIRSGLPNLISMQGVLTHYMLKNRLRAREYFCAGLEWRILRRATDVTCESPWAMELVGRRTRRARIHHVDYGVDAPFFEMEWKPDPDRKAAVFVGSVAPRKGIQDLIRAFAAPELADVELWVCGGGGGSWAERLRRSATPNVKWLGYLDREETARRLGAAWCLALPTRCDTGPTVVKESRVVGLPVVTTPCGGQRNYITAGKNGFHVPPGDIGGLRRALGKVFADHDRCVQMGGFRWREQRDWFQPSRTGQAFARLYKEVASAQQSEN